MSMDFQHQKPLQHYGFTRPAPQAQHGQTAKTEMMKLKPPRSFAPRPGY